MTRYAMTVLPAVLLVLGLLLGGCDEPARRSVDADASDIEVPPHVSGTVAEYARLVNGGYMPVEGYGLVVGLGTTGSAEVPPNIERYLRKELQRIGIGSYRHGTEAVSPRMLLSSPDTAVVRIRGLVPPGAPKGHQFDLEVEALPETQTTSLDGGTLWATRLYLAVPGADPTRTDLKIQGWARGPIFVNPFVDPAEPQNQAKLRRGRIIGGGVVARSRPVKLQLLRPDYARCDLIQDCINLRFGGARRVGPRQEEIANAISSSVIDVRIPERHRYGYRRFLDLMMHLPVRQQVEAHARQIRELMLQSGANHHELAMVWEAMGRQILPVIVDLYGAEDPSVAFHAARTGLRLGDRNAALAVVTDFARRDGSPHQLAAIEELGRHPQAFATGQALRELLSDDDEMVRTTAYEALVAQRDLSMIRRFRIGDQLVLDVVRSKGRHVIYATQAETPRLVLFGEGIKLARPMFYNSSDDLLTIDCPTGAEKAKVMRRLPHGERYSPAFEVTPEVTSLVKLLCGRPEPDDATGEVEGLGLTYGQLVRVLNDLCERRDVRAELVLQKPPALRARSRAESVAAADEMSGS